MGPQGLGYYPDTPLHAQVVPPEGGLKSTPPPIRLNLFGLLSLSDCGKAEAINNYCMQAAASDAKQAALERSKL